MGGVQKRKAGKGPAKEEKGEIKFAAGNARREGADWGWIIQRKTPEKKKTLNGEKGKGVVVLVGQKNKRRRFDENNGGPVMKKKGKSKAAAGRNRKRKRNHRWAGGKKLKTGQDVMAKNNVWLCW